MKPPEYVVRYRAVVECPSCGFKFYVVVFHPATLNEYAGVPASPRIAGIVESLKKCMKCGRQLGSPKAVNTG